MSTDDGPMITESLETEIAPRKSQGDRGAISESRRLEDAAVAKQMKDGHVESIHYVRTHHQTTTGKIKAEFGATGNSQKIPNPSSKDEEDSEVEEEKISRNWSVLKSNPELRKTKPKPKKENVSLEEAVHDSENLTDFLMDFEGDE
ncbi:PREDICTED: uncharacterized protein LOC109166935 [Ipomoea nil]|uniref:uncharacterized protein LOC109166935 n=1 Tax=Ipomoea nil TaxID=35883 RepID=UPI000900B6C4|nr:PREDICTED: uncharacterized protein LOC109166935 [Ipomoea nil]